MLSSVSRVGGQQQSESIVILLVKVRESPEHDVACDDFGVWVF
jgi:hypothetical protein